MSTPVEPTDVAQLCAAHYRPLHAHVRRKLPQRCDADDVVQETWLRVVKVAASGLLSNGRAYLYRVAHNLIADHYRQRQRRREEALDDAQLHALADPAPLPEQHLLDAEQLRHLDAIIAALPPRSRQVFLLARVEQMALAEIGRQLGISRQTAHGHLLRALVALQQVPGA
ncbi:MULTISPECIES: RNA polymerase sigma factor [Stenotrophomonas]|uniref:Sigma-70 family RNA polymerase sigma factor n=1 Tax=Stenotrophomonas maltophilia TaxID=40324 RepID=A0AAD0BRV2_STEMA|nr:MULTISPECIES: sigma-70 family RNA polymerase sigma factor [Stenotrophomonas]AUI08056.1 sigma-70 family RNA polymerase sigma factor [Stenotrophomonas maltophilia]EKU9977026.1 sigma-70 family RNA polymerase sigma factor [Stenotrophomonas maltophilia]KMU65921.1 RNA polymerase sigma-70 factor, ECF subfamily [Stenotrophomonas maltophilia]MBA2128464.1 sigma-70 family RNA polymerase sigma factor [Stenotrophomonas maltophilia]MBH1681048.1 sigma-70 family RNA polymerase sigma factor [Stenotrophomona